MIPTFSRLHTASTGPASCFGVAQQQAADGETAPSYREAGSAVAVQTGILKVVDCWGASLVAHIVERWHVDLGPAPLPAAALEPTAAARPVSESSTQQDDLAAAWNGMADTDITCGARRLR